MNRRNLTLIMENKPGALARVVGLFHQRGFHAYTTHQSNAPCSFLL